MIIYPCLCQTKAKFTPIFTYTEPPVGEIRFEFSNSVSYYRQVLQCQICGHFISMHNMDDSNLYSNEYVNANYRDDEGVKKSFERIINLPPEKSDNVGRVNRIIEFTKQYFPSLIHKKPKTILDVGSGLGVFPYKIKEAGWLCTALDPDSRSVNHIQQMVDVETIHGDFMLVQDIGQFDVISFNKVLEHVTDPVAMLAKSKNYVKDGGFVYIELPDGEIASQYGAGREEFFIDHLYVFSMASLALLATRAGFSVQSIERLQEPSTKYTLRAFLTKKRS